MSEITLSIIETYAWVNLMPGCASNKIMFITTFNENVINKKITKISIRKAVSTDNNKWEVNLSDINTFKYEIRQNEIIIREGPDWNGKLIIEFQFEIDEQTVMLVSDPTPVESVY